MKKLLRGTAALIAVIAATASATLLPQSAAQAAPPEIVVSSDGVHFVPELTAQLFGDLALLVPGDATDASLWVRNQSGTTALVRVAVDDLVLSSPDLGAVMTLTTSLNDFTYASSLDSLSNCQIVVQEQTIPAGSTVRVDFEVLMSDATSGLTAQGENATLGFVVSAHDWAAGPFPDDDGCSTIGGGGDGGSTTPQLPWTGAGDVTTSFLVAGALIGFGILFAAARRRRREGERQAS